MSERDLDPLPDDVALLLDAERTRPAAGRAPRDRVAARLSAALGPALLGVAGATASGTAATAAAAAGAVTTGAAGGAAVAGAAAGGTAIAGAAASGAAAAGAAAGAGTGVLPAIGGASFLGGLLAKPFVIGVTMAAIGAGAVGVYTVQTTDEPPRAATVTSAAPTAGDAQTDPVRAPTTPSQPQAAQDEPAPQSTVAPSPDAPAPTASPLTTSAAATAPASSPSAPSKPGHDSDLAAERSLLEDARAAIVRGQGATALSTLDRHASQFPRGRLSEEREALRVQALVAAGRRTEARERAERFRDVYPRSLALPALEQAVGPL
jgi:hypothetical protein